ncbi:hypothetical protein GCM10025734_31010 [Kitasatospora paranensis]
MTEQSSVARVFNDRPTPITASTVQQKPSGMPFHRYVPFGTIDLPDRTWPGKVITQAPAGCPPTCGTATRR